MAQPSKDFTDSFFASRCLEPDDDILEFLRSLEEVNEESFPYYTLVRWLRISIEQHLEDYYDAEPNNVSAAAWKAAARDAYNTIMETPQMVRMLEGIRNGGTSPEHLVRDLSLLNIASSENDSSSIDDVWWTPSIQPQQYQQISEDISARRPLQIRINALKLLLGSHMTVEGLHWHQLRRGLKEALCDEHEAIFQLGLKIHVKLLSSAEHFAIKEAFVNLIESVSTNFMSRKMLPNIPTIETGIDLNKPLHLRLVKILQLISNAQREVSKEWVRFSPRKVEEMIECFIDLVSMHTYDGVSREKYLYPFHILSIIDCDSNWILHWSHGIFSRNLLFRALSRSSPLLRFTVETMLLWMEDFDPIQYLNLKASLEQVKSSLQSVPGQVVHYTVFTSSLHILQTLVSFEAGHALFSVMQPDICVGLVATACVDFLNGHFDEIGMLSPVLSTLVCKFLPKLADTVMLLAILQPVLEAHADRGQETTYVLPTHTVCILESLVSTEEGFRCLTGGRKPRGSFRHRTSQENLSCLAKTLAEYLTAVLKSHRNADIKLLNSVLSICSALRLSHDQLLYLESTGLFLALNHFYKSVKQKLEHEMFSTAKPLYSYAPLLRHMLQCYLSILRTPKGFYLLENDGILHDVMQDLFEHNLVNWQRPDDRLLMSQACCYASGALAVREERLVAEQLGRAWHGEEEKDVLLVLAAVCVSFISTQLQLDERPGSEETLLALYGPRSLSELLEASVLEEEDEAVQRVGLSLLALLVANPDFALHLEVRFNLQERLLQRQKENAVSPESSVIVDELSVLRNHILVQLMVPGGPGEHVVPPATCDTFEFPWPLFSSLPVPREYMKSSGRVQASKRQQVGELHRFLTDSRPGVHDAQWLLHCRRAAKASLQAQEEVKGTLLLDLVKQVMRASPTASILLGNLGTDEPRPEETLGIAFTIRYGAQLRLVQAVPQTHDNLRQLLRISRTLRPSSSDCYSGFDWLVATVFLVLGGNIERSHSFLQSLSSLRWAPLVWSTLAERCKIRAKLEATVSHLVEFLLVAEDPQLLLAFQSYSVSAGYLICGWIRRCFWGVLDWSGITQWLLLAVLAEPDTVLYLSIAMLRHVRSRLLSRGPLMLSLERFNIGEALTLVETLSRRHRHKVLPYLQAALNASTSISLINLAA